MVLVLLMIVTDKSFKQTHSRRFEGESRKQSNTSEME